MYRVVLYGLLILAGYAVILSVFNFLSFHPLSLVVSSVVLIITCWTSNTLFAKAFKAPASTESYFITALILFFLLLPPTDIFGFLPLVLGGVMAMASKYLLVIRKKHIFNPAAISAFILGFLGMPVVFWWVSAPVMLPVLIVVGVLIVRKTRRFVMITAFFIVAMITTCITQGAGMNPIELLTELLFSWPLVFFMDVMLTEPLTSPSTQRMRIVYGSLVGILFGSQFQLGPINSGPELALIVGNIFSYIVSPKEKLMLRLKEKIQLAPQIYEFIFETSQKFSFRPGQYFEWTFAHKNPDTRGIKRYFTIASSPTEKEIHLGVRVNEKGSSFKKALLDLESGSGLSLIASQLSGDFVLPEDTAEKLVFIAGGIGVTPYRSMAQYMIDQKQQRDIVLFYACVSSVDFVFKNIFEKAKAFGFKTMYVITHKENAPAKWSGKVGYLTKAMIEDEVPDFASRMYYLSGPQMMVDSYKALLFSLGIQPFKIKTDYFPGF